MKKRPKSREETPKEGSSNARSATAPQQYAAATHKVQGLSSDFPCNEDIARLLSEKPRFSFFDKEIQWVDSHLHTNEAYAELSSQHGDRYLASIWLGVWSVWADGMRIQNTRVQIKTALHVRSELS